MVLGGLVFLMSEVPLYQVAGIKGGADGKQGEQMKQVEERLDDMHARYCLT